MPQYYAVLDNGVKPKEKAMAKKRRNQNRTYAAAKVNWRMREGSNYYGDISGVKKKNPNPRTSGTVADRAGRARTSGRTADSYAGRVKTSRNYKKGSYR